MWGQALKPAPRCSHRLTQKVLTMSAVEGVGDLGRPSYQLPAFDEFTADLGLLTLLHGLGKDSLV